MIGSGAWYLALNGPTINAWVIEMKRITWKRHATTRHTDKDGLVVEEGQGQEKNDWVRI